MYNSSKRESIDDNYDDYKNDLKRFKREESQEEQIENDSDTSSCYEFDLNLKGLKDEFLLMKTQIKHLKQQLATYKIMDQKLNETNAALIMENAQLKCGYLERIELLEEENENLQKQLKSYQNNEKVTETGTDNSQVSFIMPHNIFDWLFNEFQENLFSLSAKFNIKLELIPSEFYSLTTKDSKICKFKGSYENILATAQYFLQESSNLSDNSNARNSPISKLKHVTLQLILSKCEAAYLIGKNGKKIQEIRAKYQIRVDISKTSEINFRICKIRGTSLSF
jgi:uncharacterized protein (UPF0335 family)